MKRVLPLILVFCVALSLTACGNSGGSGNNSSDSDSVNSTEIGDIESSPTDVASSEDTDSGNASDSVESADTSSAGSGPKSSIVNGKFQFETQKYKGKTLTFWSHWDMSQFLESAQEFMDKTGVKIKAENVATYEDYKGKVSAAISAGSGPDCFWMYPAMVPAWAKAGMLKSWDDVVNLNAEPFKSELSQPTLEMYKYNNKHYGIYPTDQTSVFLIYYNKSMFNASGIEDPYTLYKQGKWNWTKFSEIAEQMCYDSDGDGINDTFAFNGSIGNVLTSWLISNGANEVIYVNGKPKFGLTEPAAIAALEMYYKAIEYGGTNSGAPAEADFLNEKIAMYLEGSYSIKQYLEKMGDNLGIVPVPNGPNVSANSMMNNRLNSVPFGIPSTCKNTELLGHFMEWYFQFEGTPKQIAEKEELWKGRHEMRDFLNTMYAQGSIANGAAFGNLTALLNGKVYTDINMGADAATVVKAYANQAQSIIDDVLK